jgi:NitT/TauT family transport system ATP-binding protein
MAGHISLIGVRQEFWVRPGAGEATANGAGRGHHQFVALDDLDLEVGDGELVTLVGPSGCGKSTVLDLVAGLSRPTAGTVQLDGHQITGPGLDRGVVFQQYTLLPWRTALGNIEFALESAGFRRGERRERARHYLDLVGLTDFAGRYPHELSGGMKQRVAIARSLSYEPEVLLMDEPYGALDAQTRERLQQELLSIWRRTGTTIVFITHDIDEAVFLGQRVGVMSSRPGRLKAVVDVALDHGGPHQDVRSSEEFARHRHHVWSLLRSDLKPASDLESGTALDAGEVGRVA